MCTGNMHSNQVRKSESERRRVRKRKEGRERERIKPADMKWPKSKKKNYVREGKKKRGIAPTSLSLSVSLCDTITLSQVEACQNTWLIIYTFPNP